MTWNGIVSHDGDATITARHADRERGPGEVELG